MESLKGLHEYSYCILIGRLSNLMPRVKLKEKVSPLC